MSPRRARVVAAVIAIVLIAGGCGRDSGEGRNGARADSGDEHGHAEGGAHEGEGGRDGHAHTEPTLVDPKTGKQGRIRDGEKYAATQPPPAEPRPADTYGVRGDVPLTAQVSPPCVEHGREVTVVFRSDPGVTVAAQMKFPNDEFSGLDNTRGQTGPEGTLTWKVLVKPSALYGQAVVQAAALDERDNSRKGTAGEWLFVVAPPGRC